MNTWLLMLTAIYRFASRSFEKAAKSGSKLDNCPPAATKSAAKWKYNPLIPQNSLFERVGYKVASQGLGVPPLLSTHSLNNK
jgi:hypothetical protein